MQRPSAARFTGVKGLRTTAGELLAGVDGDVPPAALREGHLEQHVGVEVDVEVAGDLGRTVS